MRAFIRAEGVSLSVPIYLQRERGGRSWLSMLTGAAFDPPRRELVRLLDDISFEAHEGDRIAILGRNGAGKSTLLRVLNGVYAPTSGRVEIGGSSQALLNMSLGFNSEATVRENIFLRGTAMRLPAAHLRGQVDAILDFAGLHDKTNHRLRTLSAGQKMRLGFAISTTLQHDVILMDEWVGAGDSEFIAKATERMKSRVLGSKIVMLASHSVGLLRDICNKGILLDQGRLVYAGDIAQSLRAYHALMEARREEAAWEHDTALATGELTYGCVESIAVEDGAVWLQGWCINADGSVPAGLAIEAAGTRFPPAEVERYARPDVMRHLGLTNDLCGFRARFTTPGVETVADLRGELRVLGGRQAGLAQSPLRIAPAVNAILRA